ncbi:MAG: hypothetical protein ACTSPB_21130 [Candidatus Thorarchaeota archaeon]
MKFAKFQKSYISPSPSISVPVNDMKVVRRINRVLGDRPERLTIFVSEDVKKYIDDEMWKNRVYSAGLIISLFMEYVREKEYRLMNVLEELELAKQGVGR